ncbi:6562_t:CDS:2 [Gigaspora rosea]|nr:6562_t:CDS:2 [Gigaspora rosea]
MEVTEVIKFDGGKNKTEGDRNSSEMATMSMDMKVIGIKEDTVPDTKKAGARIKGKIEMQTQPGIAQKDSMYTRNTNMVAEIASRNVQHKNKLWELLASHSHSVLPNKRLKIVHNIDAAEADSNDLLCATRDTNLWLLITELKEKLTNIEQQIAQCS